MGLGDEIMAGAQAHALFDADQSRGPVAILDKNGNPRAHHLWDGLPWVSHGAIVDRSIVNGSSCRPYVDYERSTPDRWAYSGWRVPRPGTINLDGGARQRALTRHAGAIDFDRRFVVIEPWIKATASPNKLWGLKRCQGVVAALPELQFVQLKAADDNRGWLAGVARAECKDFGEACAILARAAAAVLPEGGLHHAAAALGVPAVVIFGGMTSPANTGYESHINLFTEQAFAGEHGPCGRRTHCDHCALAMASIAPEIAVKHLKDIAYE